jgi:hypothetical protein
MNGDSKGSFLGLDSSCTIDYCPALAALVSPVQNIIFFNAHIFSLYYSPDRPATWAGRRAGSPVSVSRGKTHIFIWKFRGMPRKKRGQIHRKGMKRAGTRAGGTCVSWSTYQASRSHRIAFKWNVYLRKKPFSKIGKGERPPNKFCKSQIRKFGNLNNFSDLRTFGNVALYGFAI